MRTADRSPRPRPGDRIGNYAIEKILGRGGEGDVYLARDIVLQRPLALKVLRDVDGTGVRGLEEARLASSLSHPNIVRILHAQLHKGAWYVAMEYVDGGSVDLRVRRLGRLDTTSTLSFGRALADALHHAHQVGVLHRDVKPHNLLLSRAGTIKLSDFGLALLEEQVRHLYSRPLTPVGTPGFLAPELWSGASPTAQSDVYGLGACLFFMLAGHPPFVHDSVDELRRAHLEDTPRLPSRVHPAVTELVLGCLAKAPSARPASAADLREQLDELLRASESVKRRSTPGMRAVGSVSTTPLDGGFEAAHEALLELPPQRETRAALLGALEEAPQLVILHGGDEHDRELVTHATLVELAGVYVAARLKLRDPGDDLVAMACERLGLPARRDGSEFERIAEELRGDGGPGPRNLLHLQARHVLSETQRRVLWSLARQAQLDGLRVLLCCSSEAYQGLLPVPAVRGIQVRPIMLRPPTREEAENLVRTWVEAAGSGRLLWTDDAILLAVHRVQQGLPLGVLLPNAGTIALAAGMRIVNTWCVLGAERHGKPLRRLDEVDDAWRTPPASWPPSELHRLLRSLQNDETDANRAEAAAPLGRERDETTRQA